ncbi:MAG: response regulator transcription factor [Candidatus Acidiferrum sp.]
MASRILIVDDSPPIRHCIRTYIEELTEFEICGEAENGQIAVEKTKDLRPDLVILDLSMPVMNGLDAARQINRASPDTPLILFTMHNSEALSKEAKLAGIRNVLSKEQGMGDLLFSVRALLGM